MTWTQIDDGLNFSPQTMPGTVSNAALGLWVRLCVHTAYQLRFPAFDGAFDLTVVRSLQMMLNHAKVSWLIWYKGISFI